MGISGIGIWQLLIILMIVIMLFGSKRLGSLGSDLGKAVSGFRKAMDGKGSAVLEDGLEAATDSRPGVESK